MSKPKVNSWLVLDSLWWSFIIMTAGRLLELAVGAAFATELWLIMNALSFLLRLDKAALDVTEEVELVLGVLCSEGC